MSDAERPVRFPTTYRPKPPKKTEQPKKVKVEKKKSKKK